MKQIFKMNVPIEILFSLLEKVCIENDKYFLFDLNSFRKLLFYSEMKDAFLEQIKPYYHTSKQFYVTRKLSYNSMVNIIRQICKSNNTIFSKNLSYNHSKYTIVYCVYKKKKELIVDSGGGGDSL